MLLEIKRRLDLSLDQKDLLKEYELIVRINKEIRDEDRTCHDIIYKAGAHIKIVIFYCLNR